MTAEVGERQHALITYAIKLTRAVELVNSTDIAALRHVGLSDNAIHDVVAIVAYFNFVNRIASGLGVDLEKTDETQP